MAKLKVKLARNLRRNIQRGHPWVYREALQSPPQVEKAQLAQVSDGKGELAWAIFDPHIPLSLRILSTDAAPPGVAYFHKRFQRALDLRRPVRSQATNAFRLFNGEGDGIPGLVCDVYDSVAVVQFDGQGPSEYWDIEMITQWLLANSGCKTVIEKTRRSADRTVELRGGVALSSPEIIVQENGVKFNVHLEKGQKTGFFLDQRENREYIRRMNTGKRLLNLFSYTGGFSCYAGLGQAEHVASLDIAKGAIEMANQNWVLNGLDPKNHQGLAVDVFDYLANEKETWDHIIVDPPSMGHSEEDKGRAKAKYVEAFTAAARRVAKEGHLSLSSCSSHVSFEDFFEIITESLSEARRRGQILRVSGQGPDHPFPHACPEMRYLKFVHLVLG